MHHYRIAMTVRPLELPAEIITGDKCYRVI